MNTREKSEILDLTADEINYVAGGPAGQSCNSCSYKTGTYRIGTDQISTFLDFYFDGD